MMPSLRAVVVVVAENPNRGVCMDATGSQAASVEEEHSAEMRDKSSRSTEAKAVPDSS